MPKFQPSAPLKLLVVNHSTLFGGAEKNLADLLSRFPPHLVRTLAIVAPGQGPARLVWERMGAHCVDLPVPYFTRVPLPLFGVTRLSLSCIREFLKCIIFRRKLKELIYRETPDLVYASSPNSAIAVAPVLADAQIPWIWQIPDLVRNRLLNRIALRRAIRSSHAIMAISHATAQAIVVLGADPSKVYQIYCGVDVKSFDVSAEPAKDFRREEGIDADVPLVGMFGQITWWKGWHVLVEAMPEVVRRLPAVRFLFVGRPMTDLDSRYQFAIRTRLVKLGMEPSVRWTGFRTDIPRIMSACDVIVHASVKPEPLGVVIIEGLAARKAVICTSGGGTEEIITHNETGLVVPPGDPGALAEAIMKLLTRPTLRAQLGTRGREVVESRFTNERRVEAFLNVVRQVAEAGAQQAKK